MRRNRLSALLVAVGLLGAACAGGPGASPGPTTPAASPTAGETTPPAEKPKVALILGTPRNDLGWSQAGYEGATKLQQEGLIDLTVVDNVTYSSAAVEPVVTQFAEQGYDLVIAHSFSYGDALEKLHTRYPDTAFAWAGGVGGSYDNVADYDQPFHEGGYLLGILAGALTETGVLGGTAGFDIPVCHSMLEAFKLGAREIRPDVKMRMTFIGSWVDVEKTKEATLAMADQGADQFISCGVPEGTIPGAVERNATAYGYVVDQSSLAPENIAASMVWNLSETFRQMVQDVQAGTFVPAKYYSVGVKDDGILIKVNPEYGKPIPEEALAKMDEVIQKIKAGEFEVPFVPE